MPRRPGTPQLLRELNDRSALELLLNSGPLTRAQLGQRTGLSKVTAAQLLSRLQDRGLVEVAGEYSGARGPNAVLYAVVPSSAYVAGLDVDVFLDKVTVAVADITGEVTAEVSVDPSGPDPVRVVHDAVHKACRTAAVDIGQLRAFVVGMGGIIDPRTGDIRWSYNQPDWHHGVRVALERDLQRPVILENDVNLAAVAEREYGVGADDFVLMYIDVGEGLGIMMDGKLRRGMSGGAGEIGWLPVPGEPPPKNVKEPQSGSFQRLAGGQSVRALAETYGCARPTLAESVEHGSPEFLDELARRISIAVTSVSAILDPGLVVMSGEVGRAGGADLAQRIEEIAGRMCPTPPRVVVTGVAGNPKLRGALCIALQHAREEVFSG